MTITAPRWICFKTTLLTLGASLWLPLAALAADTSSWRSTYDVVMMWVNFAILLALLVATTLGGGFGFFYGRPMTSALKDLNGVIERLTKWETAGDVPHLGRQDEIGLPSTVHRHGFGRIGVARGLAPLQAHPRVALQPLQQQVHQRPVPADPAHRRAGRSAAPSGKQIGKPGAQARAAAILDVAAASTAFPPHR